GEPAEVVDHAVGHAVARDREEPDLAAGPVDRRGGALALRAPALARRTQGDQRDRVHGFSVSRIPSPLRGQGRGRGGAVSTRRAPSARPAARRGEGGARARHSVEKTEPPSTTSVWPVMNALSSEARKTTVPRTSSGKASRRSERACITAWS